MRPLSFARKPTVGVLLVLAFGACGAPHNIDLFHDSGTLSGSGAAGFANGLGAHPYAGTGNAAGTGTAAGTGNGAGNLEGVAGEAASSGGARTAPPGGDATSGAFGSYSGASGSSTNGGSVNSGGHAGNVESCARFGSDASYFAATQHCYLVVREQAAFDAAQAHCKTLGAHLVTLADQSENDFAWSLDKEAHWIGASDGKAPNSPDPGTFTWVTGEPLKYSVWSSGQPNATDTDCGQSGLTGHCYEHCAFQWSGGAHEGEWNDRFCLHTIASICELDSAN